jgi:hypothetical protein
MKYAFERRLTKESWRPSMLERTSRFVLEVLPYLIVAMCAGLLLHKFLST